MIDSKLVEIRLLQAKRIDPFRLNTDLLQRTLEANIDAHIQAVLDEHLYLQSYIAREYKQFFQIGTLLKANRSDVTEKDLLKRHGMKVRRLQQLLDEGQWEDHGYAYEREDGSCAFSYNTLVWGRIGAKYNHKLQTAGTKLDEVQTVIPTGDQLRWLEVEDIEGNPKEIKARLDEACKIPTPRAVSIVKSMTA